MTASRAAAALTLAFVVCSAVHFAVFEQPLVPERTAAEVAEYVKLHPSHLRAGIVLDIIIFAVGASLAAAFFTVVRETSRLLANVALALTLLPFGVSMSIELSSFALLGLAQPGAEALQPMFAVVSQTRAGGYALVMLVYSVGLGLFFALLPRAGTWPRAVGLAGAAVCLALCVATAGSVLAPAGFRVPVTVASSLLIVFQLVSTFWLFRSGAAVASPPAGTRA